MTLSNHTNLELILIAIYCFVDDFIKTILPFIRHAIKRPDRVTPPTKKHNLTIAELVSLAIFRFFTGHKNWKEFYQHLTSYHAKDFPSLPTYQNFINAVNHLSGIAALLLHGFMSVFKRITKESDPKFVDSTKLEVCKIKREFTHKVCKGLANKSKSSM